MIKAICYSITLLIIAFTARNSFDEYVTKASMSERIQCINEIKKHCAKNLENLSFDECITILCGEHVVIEPEPNI